MARSPFPWSNGCPLVAVLNILYLTAYALAVTAEQKRSTATRATTPDGNYTYCKYGSDAATWIGVAAAALVLAAQAAAAAASRCVCSEPMLKPVVKSSAIFSILTAFSWLTFVVAEACLLAPASAIAFRTDVPVVIFRNPPSCKELPKGVFTAGGAFALLTGSLTIGHYIFRRRCRDGPSPDGENGLKQASIKSTFTL